MPYTGSKASVVGYAAVLSVGPVAGTTSPTFVAIGEVISIKIPEAKRNVVMTTNFNSPGGSVEKLAVAIDYGQIEFTCNRVSTDAGQIALLAASTSGNGNPYLFEVQLPVNAKVGQTTTGDLLTFAAIITGSGGFEISTSAPAVLSYTLDITGVLTVTAGA